MGVRFKPAPLSPQTQDPDLIPANVRAGIDILGTVGTLPANAIKSIQRGYNTLTATTTNTTIASIVPNNSIILVSAYSTSNSITYYVRASIESATSLLFYRREGTTTATYIHWIVIEFNNVKSVQRGTISGSLQQLIISTSSVDMSKSFLLANFTGDSYSVDVNQAMIEYWLNAPNQIVINQASANYPKYYHWQLIEFN